MVSRGRHPKSDVAKALRVAAGEGLDVRQDKSGHRWGWVRCPGCEERFTVWSTPRNAGNHASQLVRFVARHRH